MVRRRLPAEIRHRVDSIDIVQSVWKSFLRDEVRIANAITVEDLVPYLTGMAKLKIAEKHRRLTQTQRADIRKEASRVANDEHAVSDVSAYADRKQAMPGDIAVAKDNWERTMEKVGERGQQVLQLRLQGFTLDEISERTEIGKRTVQRILASALQSLTL
jgi:RNA polymerase sigma factor (sigma-70 family)